MGVSEDPKRFQRHSGNLRGVPRGGRFKGVLETFQGVPRGFRGVPRGTPASQGSHGISGGSRFSGRFIRCFRESQGRVKGVQGGLRGILAGFKGVPRDLRGASRSCQTPLKPLGTRAIDTLLKPHEILRNALKSP